MNSLVADMVLSQKVSRPYGAKRRGVTLSQVHMVQPKKQPQVIFTWEFSLVTSSIDLSRKKLPKP